MPSQKILIVEDEAIVAMDLQNRLTRLNYEITGVVSTGETALERIQEQKPDLVLMDIRLRGRMDGVETAHMIRARHQIPVVYLSAHSDEATVERAKLTEPFGYLLKPFDERCLRTTIEVALHRHKQESDRKQTVSDLIVELTAGRKA